MKRLSLALVLGAVLLCPARVAQSQPAPADTCAFDHPILFRAAPDPPQPCAGQLVQLVIRSCAQCDDVLSAGVGDDGTVYLEFLSHEYCPRTPCQEDSLAVSLGYLTPGPHSIRIESHARVL